jgi:succinoglycan biosynthesis protein ExoM
MDDQMIHPLPADVAVGMCTFRRPAELRRLVELLPARLAESDERSFRIVIFDDSPEGSGQPAIESLPYELRSLIVYEHLGGQNISKARNRVLELCTALSEWVLLIDDDCTPDPRWLQYMREVQIATGADIVTGRRLLVAPPNAPLWLTSQPFLEYPDYADGEEPEFGNTNNTLIRSAWLRASGLRFRIELGVTGGEDMAFFYDARQLGVTLRYSAKSVVSELWSPLRLTYRYQLRRNLWLGNNQATIATTTGQYTRGRLFLRGARRMLNYSITPFARIMRRQPPRWRWTLATIAEATGLVIGAIGLQLRHR